MPNIAIKVEDLHKRYIIGHQQQEGYTALRDVIATGMKSFGRSLNPFGRKIVSLAYKPAEAIEPVNPTFLWKFFMFLKKYMDGFSPLLLLVSLHQAS